MPCCRHAPSCKCPGNDTPKRYASAQTLRARPISCSPVGRTHLVAAQVAKDVVRLQRRCMARQHHRRQVRKGPQVQLAAKLALRHRTAVQNKVWCANPSVQL